MLIFIKELVVAWENKEDLDALISSISKLLLMQASKVLRKQLSAEDSFF